MILNVGITILTLLAAAYFDLKKKTVPEIVIYPLLIIGFFVTLLNISQFTGIFAYFQLIAAAMFLVVSLIMWRSNLLGGADILLFLGIILITPTQFFSIEYFFGIFFFSCICALAYYILLRLFNKSVIDSNHIKFVPPILIGYLVTVFGLFGAQILTAII